MVMIRFMKKAGVCCGLAYACVGAGEVVAVDKGCIDYYTVGESRCDTPKPVESPFVSQNQGAQSSTLVAPKGEVDKFLENYGKPPREFVEFYLNPTSENAQKWVAAYRQILNKSQDVSAKWSEAEQLYAVTPTSAVPFGGGRAPQRAVEMVVPAPKAEKVGVIGKEKSQNVAQGGIEGRSGVVESLTYYYSQTCPYCARLNPELAELYRYTGGKFVFTCVDVTPLGDGVGPNKEYMSGKIPCETRLPMSGEVAAKGVRQTPTLILSRRGQEDVVLSGYMSKEQLLSYFK